MKKKERRMILLLIIVSIIIIAILVKIRNGRVGEESRIEEQQNGQQSEEFVEVSEDGTKINKSEKLAETKTFENYEISNVQLTANNGESLILADVKNTGEAKTEVTLVDISLLNKDGSEITTINGIIGAMEPGQVVQLNASATTDFANAYDFSIKNSTTID